ncbi:MAG: GGDEF domain-containing phosphodiesterase [Butyrivibrio sp.]|nr:GGDEF domain-containing phosphodiesterase [Butyrivibrio sp.]
MKKLLAKISYWFGFENVTKYEHEFFIKTNVSTCQYMAALTMGMEIWMIFYQLKRLVDTQVSFTAAEFFSATKTYWILFVFAALICVYTTIFINNTEKCNKNFAVIAITAFSLVCLGFGMYVSQIDYSKNKQILCFLTMAYFVACLLVWRPYISIVFLGAVFWAFYQMMEAVVEEVRSGDRINYFIYWFFLTMLSISIYHHRMSEARKTEQLEITNANLEYISITDAATHIWNMNYFVNKSSEFLKNSSDISQYRFIFINIQNFANYNEKYGYTKGNELLKQIAQKLVSMFKEHGIVARQADNHFVALINTNELYKLKDFSDYLKSIDDEVRLNLKAGSYSTDDVNIDPNRACDRARYAATTIDKYYDKYLSEYDESMEKDHQKRRYIINHLEDAIEKGYIKPYYQPVTWAKGRELCGFEALARWIDPEYGFLSPGDFVPILEEYREIHKLDRCIVESVVRDLSELQKAGLRTVPVSLNFSRLDFELSDAIRHLDETLKKYNVDKKWVHVEITESALSEYHDILDNSINRLHDMGFSLWLDDFGSGYSALNVLKDYNFDVLKIDMAFLSNFGTNDKAKPILKSIVQMANSIGIKTLTEGVETTDEANFLESIGCGRLQGYLYGKPLPKEETVKRINDGEFIVSDELI